MQLTWGDVPSRPSAALAPLLAAAPGRIGLAYLDLATGRGWRLDDVPRPAASLVKVPLAIAAYQAAERGELCLRERVAVAPLPEDDEAEFDDLGGAPAGKLFAWRKVIDRSLTESDNAATNTLIARLGFEALDGLKNQLKLAHTKLARRMLDSVARQAGRENFTTAADLANVLCALHRGDLLGPLLTQEVLGLLGQQRQDEKLAAGLPPDVVFRHKTGELPGFRHDAGIVEDARPYVVVALAEAPAGREREADAVLARVMAALHAEHLQTSAELQQATSWLATAEAALEARHTFSLLTLVPGDPIELAGVTTAPGLLTPPAALGLHVTARALVPRAGVVGVACLQLRRGPGHAYELVSQLRLGDPVEILEEVEDWHRLRGPDGYIAFGRSNNILLERDWQPTHRVHVPMLTLALSAGRQLVLSAGSRVAATTPGHYRLPDGTEFASASGLVPLARTGTIAEVLAFARATLGLPYLWGGASCWGLDCSGLVQLAYGLANVALPRDADQQQAATGAIAKRSALAPGDLVFFPGHVGLSLGGPRYIHASAHAGMVTLNSFAADDPLYDAKLDAMFSGGGRSPLA